MGSPSPMIVLPLLRRNFRKLNQWCPPKESECAEIFRCIEERILQMITKQKIILGSVVEIHLSQEFFSYAQIITKSELAFYDYSGVRISTDSLDVVCKKPILFVLAVMHAAIKSGRWKIVGRCEIPQALKSPREYFIQDVLTKKFSIYTNNDGNIRPAERSEIEGLECAAVWEPEHVEDRLRDHFAGRQNLWVEQLKPT